MSRRRGSSIDLLLAVRSQREEAAQQLYSGSLAQLRSLEQEIDALQLSIQCLVGEREAAVGVSLSAADYMCHQVRSEEARRLLDEASARLGELQNINQNHAAAYQHARVERELIGSLIEERIRTLRTEAQRAEQRRAEELYLARFVASGDNRSERDGHADT